VLLGVKFGMIFVEVDMLTIVNKYFGM